MKHFLLLSLSILLSACSTELAMPSAEMQTTFPPPLQFSLEDASGNVLGFASVLRPAVLVGPDHLLQNESELYLNNQSIEVLARDFRHDVFFFTVPNALFDTKNNHWSDQPPGVGQNLSWQVETSEMTSPVFSAKGELVIGNTSIEDLMLLSTTTKPGDSGKPLYDPQKKVIYGMLMASDSLEAVSYFVRSDTILSLAREYLD